MNLNKTRRMDKKDSIELFQINTNKIFDIKMLTNNINDIDMTKLEYSTEISQWETNFMEIKFDFDDPSYVNRGLNKDKVMIVIKQPDLFVS